MQDLSTRILSALVMVTLCAIGLWLGGIVFYILLTVVCITAYHEWAMVQKLSHHRITQFVASFALALSIPVAGVLNAHFTLYIFILTSLTILLVLRQSFIICSRLLSGYAVITLFGVLLAELMTWGRVLQDISSHDSDFVRAWPIAFLIILNAVIDTSAYFSGRLLGRNPLAPKISPTKTIEGFMGAVITSSLFCVLIYFTVFQSREYMPDINHGVWAFILIGLLAPFVSQAGDLTESYFKRVADIKDTGKILPGHGGILDRIDGLLFLTPVYYFWFTHFIVS